MPHCCLLIAAIVALSLGISLAGQAAAAGGGSGLADQLQQLWSKLGGKRLPDDIAMSNGRMEARAGASVGQVLAGRMAQVLVEEGQTVESGAVVVLSQSILYRGADLSIVWPQMAALVAIGGVFFTLARLRFRRAWLSAQ
jgi:hypothetical protein